ncbi:MAG: hypothetical protein Q9165_002867 [Trypethelium subeluteriae]
MLTPEQKKDRRMRQAEHAVRQEWAQGNNELENIESIESIRQFLQNHAEENDWEKGYFSCLDATDIGNICAKMLSQSHQAHHASIITPSHSGSESSSPIGSETQQNSATGVALSPASTQEIASRPTYNANEIKFKVSFQHASMKHLEFATARRCQEKESFVDERVAVRHNLMVHRNGDNAVRFLCLPYTDSSSDKTISTRFVVVANKDIENDFAIGHGAFEDHETGHRVVERAQQLTLGTQRQQRMNPQIMDGAATFIGKGLAQAFLELENQSNSAGKQPHFLDEDSYNSEPDAKRSRLSDNGG